MTTEEQDRNDRRSKQQWEKKANQITAEERFRLCALFMDLRVTITAARPLEEAIISAGGVHLKEVDPRTMESKVVKGLFLCGEVLDLQGKTGGYNLQAAFSTGWVAGENAAKMILLQKNYDVRK